MSLDVYLFCPECGHTVGEQERALDGDSDA